MSEAKFVGCMVGCGIGDAMGAAYEGSSMLEAEMREFPCGRKWTDDTHMMIGVAESLIACKGFDGEHMAWTFARNWEDEPWRGYGPAPPEVFKMMGSGIPWREAAARLFNGMGSYGNGAAMRIAPVGLFYYDDEEELREVAYRSSEITHAHRLGKEGAALQAYAVALAVQARPNSLDPREFLERIVAFSRSGAYKNKLKNALVLLDIDDRSEVVRRLGNKVEAFNSVPAAIYCFAKNHEDYSSAVTYAISLGGDADTIGAMTGAIAGAYHGQEALPKACREELERGDYIESLAKTLWRLKGSKNIM